MRPDLTGAHVLIIDDSAASLTVLAAMIRSIGGVPEACSSGTDAVAAIERASAAGNRFALLMVDSKMPNVGGVEFV